MEPQQIPNHQLPPEQSPLPKINNPLEAMQPGEHVICEVKRHPLGLLGIFIAAGFILIMLAILAFVIIPGAMSSSGQSQNMTIVGVIFALVAILIILFVLIANIVYWGNRWIVTSDSITQMNQTGLFNKQSSQLSLGDLEDVTTEQNGIFTHVFNFGTIKAETAGERSKFMLTFCPNPNYYAKKILAAREVFERDHHGGKQEPYHPPQGSQPPVPSTDQLLTQPPQDTVGQTPPAYGAAPPLSAASQPPAPSTNRPPAVPSAYPETGQPTDGAHTNNQIS